MKLRIGLLVPACILPLIGALFYFVIFANAQSKVQLIYGLTKVFTLAWPLIALWVLGELNWPGVTSCFRWNTGAILLGLGLGGLICLGMLGLMQTPVGEMVYNSSEAMKAKVHSMGIVHYYWAFALVISVIHSLLEEYYWRWFVFDQLTKCTSEWSAHLIAGLAFSAHHLVVTSQYFSTLWAWLFGLAVGVGGIFWSMLYRRTGSILPIWFSHILVDLGIFWIGWQVMFNN